MLLSTLEFGSLLTYVPQSVNDEQKKAKDVVLFLKSDKVVTFMNGPPYPMTTHIAKVIAKNMVTLPFKNYFGSDVILVPVPSSGLRTTGGLWVPYNLAKALEAENLGRVIECVKRKVAVPKAATARPEERPTPKQHYESLDIMPADIAIKKIVLIDDVITRGATAVGVASKLKEVYPDADIKLFAAVRTISEPKNFVELMQPCVGEIKARNNQAFRNP